MYRLYAVILTKIKIRIIDTKSLIQHLIRSEIKGKYHFLIFSGSPKMFLKNLQYYYGCFQYDFQAYISSNKINSFVFYNFKI